MLLPEFDIVYVSQKVIKGSVVADFLASRASEDYEGLNFNFPDEDLMCISTDEESSRGKKSWTLYFDGASNALGNGIGAVLISPEEMYYPFTSRLEFFCTNNMAEYEACIMGLKAAIERKVKALKVYRDSSLVVYQLKGEWETKDSKLVEYRNLVLELLNEFEDVKFKYLPREDNQMADALATLVAMFKANKRIDMMPIMMQVYETPAHCYHIEEEIDGHPWYCDILQYMRYQTYPPNAFEVDKRTIRRMAVRYFIDGEILYRRGSDQVLLRCVTAKEAKNGMEEVHGGTSGTHANDIIGAITPEALNGHRFILVAIDYFTKWVEDASYSSITRSTVCRFIKMEIICRYGLPERIITDNATNLNNKMMEELCVQFNIKHANYVTYHLKMNGAVETANKNIKRIITKATETYRDWHEKLPFALYGYRTTVRTSTGATHLSLEVELDEAEWIQSRFDQLHLIEEKRLNAICRGQMYQKRMMRAHDRKELKESMKDSFRSFRKGSVNILHGLKQFQRLGGHCFQRFGDSLVTNEESVLPEKVIIQVRQTHWTELSRIWATWDDNEKTLFREIYGDLVEMLRVPIDTVVVRALAECWNPAYRNKDHFDIALIDFVESIARKNPAPAILAETFLSLNQCRRLGGDQFTGCASLLLVWWWSHSWIIEKGWARRHQSNFSPLVDFLSKCQIPEHRNRKEWVEALHNIKDTR
ncbi:uncharacterized protein LOC120167086 [Hibiscus syriacus]|uniref:uncharacterized protein LOC120167086 n=1 Tax=Hibiscus syriacus TaxID=106335 RepID=UPI001921180F|nr:uncharacterized protein LOC120167086 [Hibiscus syriacus]